MVLLARGIVTERCDHLHRQALRRYRLSVLSQRYRQCGRRSRLPRRDPRRGGVRGAQAEIEGKSSMRGEDSRMTLKRKRNATLEPDASPIRPPAEDTSAIDVPSDEEIRRRAYEIYLERNGLPGDELDDWHRAERELQKVALFKRGWNRLQQGHHYDSEDGN